MFYFSLCASYSLSLFSFNDPATTEIYTLSLHDALPIYRLRDSDRRLGGRGVFAEHPEHVDWGRRGGADREDRKSTRLNSSHVRISYAVFCLKKKIKNKDQIASVDTMWIQSAKQSG